jgi:hypothetical protein
MLHQAKYYEDDCMNATSFDISQIIVDHLALVVYAHSKPIWGSLVVK